MIPRKIVLHHSLTADSQTVSWAAIRCYHIDTMGWSDIGYHYGIELVGSNYETLVGRMPDVNGAHTADYNSNSLGICFVGNFDLSEPPPEQWNKGIELVSFLCRHYGIVAADVWGHTELNPLKSCPGSRFNLNGFRMQLEQQLKKGRGVV